MRVQGRRPRLVHAASTRNGTAHVLMAFEPPAGVRHAEVTDRKTGRDRARFARRAAGEGYPAAERAALVRDNRSTHAPAAVDEAFEPAGARRLCDRMEWHDAPEHGSWMSAAESERSALARQRMDRRIPDLDALGREAAARESGRNKAVVRVDGPFTTADARVKRKRLYPAIELQ